MVWVDESQFHLAVHLKEKLLFNQNGSHACSPSSPQAGTGGSDVQDQPELYTEFKVCQGYIETLFVPPNPQRRARDIAWSQVIYLAHTKSWVQ